MYPFYSPRDLNTEYQARVNAALRKRGDVTKVRQAPRLAAWIRLQVERIAPWMRAAPRQQRVDTRG